MTKLTLRKADALAKATLDAARKVPLEAVVTVSVYSPESVESVADTARATLRENLAVSTSLLEAAYQIRALIGEANRKAGIDAALTQKAELDAREKVLSALVPAATAGRRSAAALGDSNVAVLEKRREALLARVSSDTYQGYGEDSVSVRVVDDALTTEVQAQLNAIRKEKIEISDRLLELNTSTRVSLDDATVETLTKQNLL